MDLIREKHKKDAVIHSNIWMYFNNTAKTVIEDCRAAGLKVFGLEAFLLSGKGIQPSMNNSIWFKPDVDCWGEAIDFLSQEENSACLFEIWYEGY